MAQRQAELAHYATVAHFLRENVLPNCQLCARDYKELTDAFPLPQNLIFLVNDGLFDGDNAFSFVYQEI